MIINIYKNKDLELVDDIPIEVKQIIKENIRILDEKYGTERTEKTLEDTYQ